jgi:peptide/nickel transport system substrate-binding protein
MRKLVLATCALALAASGCTRVSDGDGTGAPHAWTIPGHLRIGSTDEPDNLNPMFAHTDATDQIDALIFAPVFRYDQHGDFVPELATEIPTYANGGISKDSKTIVLHWRHGVVWSDGAPLTARDLRFTWRAVMNPANATKAQYGWDDVATIDVPDPYTAIVRLKRPNANVLGILGGGGGSAYPPLPEHLLGNLSSLNRADFNAHPISSGPWLLRAWNHGSSLEFAPNARYWRGPPRLKALTYAIVPNPDALFSELQTHEIDVIPNVAENAIARLPTIEGLHVDVHLIANWRETRARRSARAARARRSDRLGPFERDDLSRTQRALGQRHPARLLGRAAHSVLSARSRERESLARRRRLAARTGRHARARWQTARARHFRNQPPRQ